MIAYPSSSNFCKKSFSKIFGMKEIDGTVLSTYHWKKIVESCSSVGAGARKVEKLILFWPNADPNQTHILDHNTHRY